MTMRLRGGILLGVLAALVTLLGVGLSAPAARAHPSLVQAGPVTQSAVAAVPMRAQQEEPTPEPGPRLDPSTQADSEKNQNKVIVGVAAGVLAVIVLWGRHIRSKRRKSNS